MFHRNETFSSYIRNYPVITAIIATNVIIYFLFLIIPYGGWLHYSGMGWNAAILAGEYWRLVTPIFLHGGLFHLFSNMFALLIFAPALEVMLGKRKFVTIYLISGVLANVATLFLESPSYTHVGASGSIFGLFGVFLFMYLYRKDLMDSQSGQTILPIIVISVIMTFVGSHINIFAHLFGLLFGFLLAPSFLKGARPFYSQQTTSRVRRAYFDDDEIQFNPQRWKRANSNRKLKKLLWVLAAIIAIILLGTIQL
ncbi:rhomboid family intramembrane serine protease [Shouchella clausii]|uniref:rhomboid family intramembrane serine protease n=1 Tax=Shouchella clausii TaxID=79880 RepID=UPI0026F445D7|nr:rhomboid family intramembrane serine protease [Shouchella clausii]MDO7284722.1 rhomboid family intramembrane serine protease [Shouchella clausii]MDO7304817.1 rhomboid family intramembrane serine protease [Shouchella clausii]